MLQEAELSALADSENSHGGSSTAYVLHRTRRSQEDELSRGRMRVFRRPREGLVRELAKAETHAARRIRELRKQIEVLTELLSTAVTNLIVAKYRKLKPEDIEQIVEHVKELIE